MSRALVTAYAASAARVASWLIVFGLVYRASGDAGQKNLGTLALARASVGLLGYAFLEASATAKIVNLATNVGALVVFAAHGAVLWPLGLVMGAANLAGGYLGARTAVGAGSRFVRVVFLAVVGVLVVRLAWQVFAG